MWRIERRGERSKGGGEKEDRRGQGVIVMILIVINNNNKNNNISNSNKGREERRRGEAGGVSQAIPAYRGYPYRPIPRLIITSINCTVYARIYNDIHRSIIIFMNQVSHPLDGEMVESERGVHRKSLRDYNNYQVYQLITGLLLDYQENSRIMSGLPRL